MAGQQEAPATVVDAVGTRPVTANLPFITPESLTGVADFEARPGDVMIVTYPKCGTTWCQQLCHQLRTGGHTEFDEISEERIVPWLEVSPGLGIDCTLSQIAEPRCFKTHQLLSALSCFEARGAKYLCVLRDPEAALLSEFKFMLSKGRPEATDKDVNTFAANSFLPSAAGGTGDYPPKFGAHIWDFYVEFWRCRAVPCVKLFAFEHLKRDLSLQIPVIADFMGITEPDAKLFAQVAELGSFAWMQSNDHLFDDHHMLTRLANVKGKGKGQGDDDGKGKGKGEDGMQVGLQVGDDDDVTMKVNSTKVGLQVGDDVNVNVTEDTRALLARAWQQIVAPVSGHETYPAMIAELQQLRS